MATSEVDVPQSRKVVWRIENFSNLNNPEGLCSDAFSFGNRKWCILLVSDKEGIHVGLRPIDHTYSYFNYIVSVIDQKDDSRTMKQEVNLQLLNPSWRDSSYYGVSVTRSEFDSANNGYLLDDTCIVEVEMTQWKSKVAEDEEDMLFFSLGCFLFLLSYILYVALDYLVPSLGFIGSGYMVLFCIGMICAATSFAVKRLKFPPNNFLETKSSASLTPKAIKLASKVDQRKVSETALEEKHEAEWENDQAVDDKSQGRGQPKVSEKDPDGSNLVDSTEVGLQKMSRRRCRHN